MEPTASPLLRSQRWARSAGRGERDGLRVMAAGYCDLGATWFGPEGGLLSYVENRQITGLQAVWAEPVRLSLRPSPSPEFIHFGR